MADNLDIAYRPLRIGISIVNGRIQEKGTLGLIAQDSAGKKWLISCYHVLCNSGFGAYVADEVIYQPAGVAPDWRVAITSAAKIDADLDCAAAAIDGGIASAGGISGLGSVNGVADPKVGMQVMKIGAATGITEGIISQVSGDTVFIRPQEGFPVEYTISAPGDSGALWISQDTRAAVALNRGIRNRTASAVSISAVLKSLNLSL